MNLDEKKKINTVWFFKKGSFVNNVNLCYEEIY